MPRISFVLPVYGVETYLNRALDSLRAQTASDWEAILVDDGSPDNCGRICDLAAAGDPRFRVIHQRNAGVSAARNAGLEMARGEFVHFLDPDDCVEPDFVEDMLREAKDADIVLFGFFTERYRSDGTTERLSVSVPPITGHYDFIAFQQVFPKLITYHYVWNRLYRRALLERRHCRFLSYSLGEDAVFNFQACAQPFHRLVALQKPYVHYSVREGSAVGRFHPGRMKDNFYISRTAAAMAEQWGMAEMQDYRRALAYCALRDLQLGIKNAAMSSMPWRDQRQWLLSVMADARLRDAVRMVPVKQFRARNDRIKLVLLKLRLYDAVMLMTVLRQRRRQDEV